MSDSLKMKTGFLTDERFMEHDTGPGHPECGERVAVTLDYLQQQDWFDGLHQLQSRPADIEQVMMIHDRVYINRAEEVCRSGNAYLDSMDVSVSMQSYDVALLAAGSALQLADDMMHGKIDNGFALLRPPGHHAEKGMALGFCLFNNVAILARYLQQQHGMDNIVIIDWDVHHGNGTQHLFEEDPSVFYISTHQFPYYPGTGNYNEVGTGRGTGFTLNCPMAAGSSDQDYETVFNQQILPKLDEFKPECILISAGFDAHQADPLGNINLSTGFFGWMTEQLMEKADQHCNNRILSLLEGGYNLEALAHCVGEHLQTLSQQKQ